jgi:chromosome segregation protein
VRLTSLTLQGFKSFGHRTTIEFSPGVTAVVGPNGSGKSNLLDALKWVTGGGRAREFRAEARTDLIFHGADGKRGVGFAEVEVELSDGRRSIKVRRDLDRSGRAACGSTVGSRASSTSTRRWPGRVWAPRAWR